MVNAAQAAAPAYKIVSVQRAKPSSGLEGSGWYGYVISYEGEDSIHGYRRGNLEAVTAALEDIVESLNERHAGRFRKTGRVQLALTPKKKT